MSCTRAIFYPEVAQKVAQKRPPEGGPFYITILAIFSRVFSFKLSICS